MSEMSPDMVHKLMGKSVACPVEGCAGRVRLALGSESPGDVLVWRCDSAATHEWGEDGQPRLNVEWAVDIEIVDRSGNRRDPGLCSDCYDNGHGYHQTALGGICVGCTCDWRPDPRPIPTASCERLCGIQGCIAADSAECARPTDPRPFTVADIEAKAAETYAEFERMRERTVAAGSTDPSTHNHTDGAS